MHHEGKRIILVDTPGFDDAKRSDLDVLREVYQWFKDAHVENPQLNAIFYLHNITDNRMRGSAVKSTHVFRKLCGENFYPNLLLGTNFWRIVKPSSMVGAELRETQLRSEDTFWKTMINGGSRVARIPDTRPEALKLLCEMAARTADVLDGQVDAVRMGRSFENLTVQDVMDPASAAARRRQQQEREALEQRAKKAREDAADEAERKRAETQRKLDEEKRETWRLEAARAKAERDHREAVAAATREQERMARRQKELEEAMRKLSVNTARKEKSVALKDKINWQTSKMRIWDVDFGNFYTPVSAHQLRCDNCLKNIGYGRYYRESLPIARRSSRNIERLISGVGRKS